jgi:polysaccharide biosynthesis transport protein
MNDDTEQEHVSLSSGLSLDFIYFVLFRHKWLIIIFAAVGVLGTIAAFAIKPARYRSEAKLYIRYVAQAKALTPPGTDAPTRSPEEQGGSILKTEAQIVKSLDVAQQVVEAIGAEKILAKLGGGTNHDQAAGRVLGFMDVIPSPDGSLLAVTYEHPDPEVALEVLRRVVVAYVKKHKEMHQTVGIFGDFLSQETERLRSELAQTEKELRAAKNKAGVTSLEDAKKSCTEQISKIRENLFGAQAELAERQAVLEETTKLVPGTSEATNSEQQISLEQINEYKKICARLDRLSQREQDLLFQFTDNSSFVQQVREQIADTEKLKKELETKYPRLASLVISSPRLATQAAGISGDPAAELAQVRALKLKIEVLNAQLAQIQAEATRIDEMEGTIVDLQRKKDLADADLKYFSANLEQSRIEDALGSGKAPNIGILQSPSPPAKGWSDKFKKKVKMVAVIPPMCGLALAFLIEMFLDRSVKRPGDVEIKLRLPLFISIPDIRRNGYRRLAQASRRGRLRLSESNDVAGSKDSSGATGMLPVIAKGSNDPLRRYYEGLRERLIVHFEVRNLNQKPKLVAVTSCGQGAGVTSIAAGLAASLSETGDGNVLLVDMSAEQVASQQFYKGKPGCGLDDALASETRQSALVQTKLYVATESVEEENVPRALTNRVASLMPRLKASDYDYIIFDLPPVSQTSMTPRVARLMDMVLLVIESEKTNQDVVRRVSSLLAESQANVSAVLNKTRTYVPAWLHQEFLSEP